MADLRLSSLLDAAERGAPSWSARLELIGGTSAKFWSIRGRRTSGVTVSWGRIGTEGRSQIVPFTEAKKRLQEKMKKGYALVDVDWDVPRARARRATPPRALSPIQSFIQRVGAKPIGTSMWTGGLEPHRSTRNKPSLAMLLQGARRKTGSTAKAQTGFYVTTFCNFAHRLSDGKPIGHECYVIAPALLKAELETGEWPEALRTRWARTRTTHRGVRGSRTDAPHSYTVTYSSATEESVENGDYDDVGFYDGRGGRYSMRRFPKSVKTQAQKRAYMDQAHQAATYTFDPADIDEDTSYVDLVVKVLQRAGASAFDARQPGDNYTTSPDENFRTGEKVYYEYKLDGFSPEELREIHQRVKGR